MNSMNRVVVIFCCTVLAGCLLWFFPLFHIERLDAPLPAKLTPESNTGKFAATFWEKKVVPTLEKAPDGKELISALRNNPQLARKQYGRKVGVSRTTLFVVQGKGTVVATDKKGVGVALEDGSESPEILLHTGLLFGNTVRDATGLLDASEFQNSREFNEVSADLNRIVETQVIPALKENARKGQRIRFVGCVELADQDEIPKPLSVIPMHVHID
jgi:predicted lipoprotein